MFFPITAKNVSLQYLEQNTHILMEKTKNSMQILQCSTICRKIGKMRHCFPLTILGFGNSTA